MATTAEVIPPTTTTTGAPAQLQPQSTDAPPGAIPTNTGALTSGSTYSVLVTGATGTTGYEVLKLMCSREWRGRFKVVAGVHRDHGPLDVLRDVDVVRHVDADRLSDLDFRQVDLLFIIPSNAENRVEQVRNYVAAAVRDRVRFILLLSVVQTPGKDTLFSRQFGEMERIVSESGIPCAFLRCAFFMQNLLGHIREVRARNTLSLPIGRGRCAPVNVIDVARASVAIMSEPQVHAYKAYDLVGPEFLDGPQISAAASRGLSMPIRFRDCTRDEFVGMYTDQGVPAWLASAFAEILELASLAGEPSTPATMDQASTGTATTVPNRGFYEALTGYKPITLENFFAEYADVFNPEAGYTRETYRRSSGAPGRARSRSSSSSSSSSSDEDRRLRRTQDPYSISRSTGPGTGAITQGEELRDLLREMVADKQRTLRSKYRWLQEEEARLDRLINLFERFEVAASRRGPASGYYGGGSRYPSATSSRDSGYDDPYYHYASRGYGYPTSTGYASRADYASHPGYGSSTGYGYRSSGYGRYARY